MIDPTGRTRSGSTGAIRPPARFTRPRPAGSRGGPPSPDGRAARGGGGRRPRVGRPRARGDGGRRTDRSYGAEGAECVSVLARVREGGAVPRGPHVSPVRRGRAAPPSPRLAPAGPVPPVLARGRDRPARPAGRRRCRRARTSTRRSDASFRATVRRHDRPQSKTGKGAAAGSGAVGRLVATGVSRRPLCLRRGVGPVCRAGLFTPGGTLLVA